MKTQVLRAEPPVDGDDPAFAELCARVARVLDSGEAVGLPTETVYGLAARVEPPFPTGRNALLESLKGRPAERPIPLAVGSLGGAREIIRLDHPGALRLAERFWPGPLTLVLPAFAGGSKLAVRIPAHPITGPLLAALKRPIHLTSANPSGRAPACSADEVVEHFDGSVPLVVDGGPAALGEASAVVEFEGPRPVVHREGLIDRPMILRTAATKVLLVCTGNTCRSPMAEAGFRRMWAKLRKVDEDALLADGALVESAGVAAFPGIRGSTEAIEVLAKEGIDLRPHRSRSLELRSLLEADHVFTLGRGHQDAILQACPEEHLKLVAGKTRALAGDVDIADPIGGDRQTYQRCWDQIREAVAQRVEEVELAVRAALPPS